MAAKRQPVGRGGGLDVIDDLSALEDDALMELESEEPEAPAFVALEEGQPPRSFFVYGGDMIIGRGDDAHLPIPAKTVSRSHARVLVTDEGCVIEDLLSDNGTYVDGMRVERQVLDPGQHVRVGTVDMVYLGAEREQQTYEGQHALDMPRYSRRLPDSKDAATLQLHAGLLKRMNEVRALIARATVQRSMPRLPCLPAATQHGGGGDIPLKGMFTSGRVAVLSWTGRHHQLRKLGRWAAVKVEGQAIEERDLKPGDGFQVGGSRFRYVLG